MEFKDILGSVTEAEHRKNQSSPDLSTDWSDEFFSYLAGTVNVLYCVDGSESTRSTGKAHKIEGSPYFRAEVCLTFK